MSEAEEVTFCPQCCSQLSYPPGSAFIQCPKCLTRSDPRAPQLSLCSHCAMLLIHPSTTHYVQCPKCLRPSNVREKAPEDGSNKVLPPFYHQYRLAEVSQRRKRAQAAARGGLSAYVMFCKKNRNQVKKNHPEVAFSQVRNILSEMWKGMSQEQKQPYFEMADASRPRMIKPVLAEVSTSNPKSPKGVEAVIPPNLLQMDLRQFAELQQQQAAITRKQVEGSSKSPKHQLLEKEAADSKTPLEKPTVHSSASASASSPSSSPPLPVSPPQVPPAPTTLSTSIPSAAPKPSSPQSPKS